MSLVGGALVQHYFIGIVYRIILRNNLFFYAKELELEQEKKKKNTFLFHCKTIVRKLFRGFSQELCRQIFITPTIKHTLKIANSS